MTNETRLTIALDHMLREMHKDELKATCNDIIDSLVRRLPKEHGGTKVQFEGRARGRSVPAVSKTDT